MLARKIGALMIPVGLSSSFSVGAETECVECDAPGHRDWVCTTDATSSLYNWFIAGPTAHLGDWTSENWLNGREHLCASPSAGGKPRGIVLLDDMEFEDWEIDSCPVILET
jgi:hypothetical protein